MVFLPGYDEEPFGYLAVCLCYLLQSRLQLTPELLRSLQISTSEEKECRRREENEKKKTTNT